jgi:prepilin-type N-terminal cleavage/methylation domain-containing protein
VTKLRRGFTLVELLVVIFVIGLLMGILIPTVSYAYRRVAINRTKSTLALCRSAIETYRNTHNRLPWVKPTDVKPLMLAGKSDQVEIKTPAVLAELRGRGTVNRTTDYLAGLAPQFVKDLGGGPTLVDAWGAEIRFRVEAASGEAAFWSLGPDGLDQTADGTSPDPAGQPGIYFLFSSGDIGDDIRGM